VEQQVRRAPLVVSDQGPCIEPEARDRQGEIVHRRLRQLFQAGTEVVSKQADQAAKEGQLAIVGSVRRAEAGQRHTQALEERCTAFIGRRGENLLRPGADDVVAAT